MSARPAKKSTIKTAGYSGTPLVQKLGIKPGHAVVFVGDDGSVADAIGALPEGAKCSASLPRKTGTVDVVVVVTPDKKTLHAKFELCRGAIKADGALWVCWPKKSSGVATDLMENDVRDLALARGLVDNKVCAVTDVWSGLRLVVPVKSRAAWPSK